jgi:uncharacterized membrane protein (UPF0127 family)
MFLLFENFCKKYELDHKEITCSLSNKEIKTTLCTTKNSQEKGYSLFSEPSDSEGLLFIYDYELPLSFWMKGVNFDLDIIFFNSNREYLNHFTMSKYNKKNPIYYNSKKPAQFALELKSGWCSQYLNYNNSKLILNGPF